MRALRQDLRCPWCRGTDVSCRLANVGHDACLFVCESCGYDGSQGSGIGYVVLTSQPDGCWRDDWDGEVHATRAEADHALSDAAAALGADAVRLCRLVPA